MLMILQKQKAINGDRTLSRKYGMLKTTTNKKQKAFQNIVAIFKVNSIDFSFFLLLYVGSLRFVVVDYLFRVLL